MIFPKLHKSIDLLLFFNLVSVYFKKLDIIKMIKANYLDQKVMNSIFSYLD